ncbi:MAG: WbqC family protein [Arenimonas sp.]
MSADVDTRPRHRVAVMQPYFFPYAGYFRLLAAADEFVLLDCVQFPRRGRVHRCQVPSPGAGEEWLTLPLASQPRDTAIRDLAFAPGARAEFDARLARHAWIAAGRGPLAGHVREHLHAPLDAVVDYLEAGLRLVADALGLPATLRRSSTLAIDPALRAQDRILAIAQACGATGYVNSPGGRDLYDPLAFAAAGMELRFLPEYDGSHVHLLPALLSEPPATLRADVLATATPRP